MADYSEGFWITLAGIVVGFLGMTIRACLKSRCSLISIGCCRIERNVNLEEREVELQLQNIHNNNNDETV